MKSLRSLALTCAVALGCCLAIPAHGDTGTGKLRGTVLDTGGTPQMGAAVWLDSEALGSHSATLQLLTDQNGVFDTQRLRPGLYSAKVTLAGFLPSLQEHIRVSANFTTLVHIELDSVFTSLGELRRQPGQPSQSDDWKWVLRTSAATRPVLQLRDGTVVIANDAGLGTDGKQKQPRARLEMTNGSVRPGSSSARPGSLATAASYDQPLGSGRLLVAGDVNYYQLPGAALGGGFASIWVPGGEIGTGPETIAMIHQSGFGTVGQSVRTMRFGHSERIAFSSGLVLDYGAEYLMAGVTDASTWSVRPHARLQMRLSPEWIAAFSFETDPDSYALRARGSALESAMDALETVPVLVWHNGRTAIAGGRHEEFSLTRKISNRASIEADAFHDYSPHQAVFGYGPGFEADLPANQFAQPYAQDGGAAGSWGTRVVYREQISNNFELAAIYARAAALAPQGNLVVSFDPGAQNPFEMRQRQSVAARASGKVPVLGTQFQASYKWLNGVVVSRQDLFGEAGLGIDPNLSLLVRQPLPSFLAGGHWEALLDIRNLLSQGYVPLDGQDGRLVLTPVERSFRGGVSFQF